LELTFRGCEILLKVNEICTQNVSVVGMAIMKVTNVKE